MKTLIFTFLIAIIGAAVIGHFMSHVEKPKYTVVASQDNIELRQYPPMIVAEVEVSGERKEAINQGFGMLADYIFGNNVSQKKVEMTAPVTTQLNERIAMTAPVMQQKDEDRWKVRFVMPSSYSLQTLPKPNSKNVVLIAISAKRFAVIRFSGWASDKNIKYYTAELETFIASQHLTPINQPILALYNPPWTLPFLRRNEVMIEVK